jgi:hypothetical protein
MKKMTLALAMFGALALSACAHGGHHGCCSGECKMESGKKSCCGDKDGECQMHDKKAAATPEATSDKK